MAHKNNKHYQISRSCTHKEREKQLQNDIIYRKPFPKSPSPTIISIQKQRKSWLTKRLKRVKRVARKKSKMAHKRYQISRSCTHTKRERSSCKTVSFTENLSPNLPLQELAGIIDSRECIPGQTTTSTGRATLTRLLLLPGATVTMEMAGTEAGEVTVAGLSCYKILSVGYD